MAAQISRESGEIESSNLTTSMSTQQQMLDELTAKVNGLDTTYVYYITTTIDRDQQSTLQREMQRLESAM
jgi:hypothetical protein